jgi:hypothetical protein
LKGQPLERTDLDHQLTLTLDCEKPKLSGSLKRWKYTDQPVPDTEAVLVDSKDVRDSSNKEVPPHEKRSSTRTAQFTLLPNVLFLAFRRYVIVFNAKGKYAGQKKLHKAIELEDELQLDPLIGLSNAKSLQMRKDGQEQYVLTGVIVHEGERHDAGHYYMFARENVVVDDEDQGLQWYVSLCSRGPTVLQVRVQRCQAPTVRHQSCEPEEHWQSRRREPICM